MDEARTLLSNNLIRLRTERGLTQEEFGRAIKKSRSTVAKIEGGDAWVGSDVLVDIARALGCRISDLFYDEKNVNGLTVDMALKIVSDKFGIRITKK